jgi:thiamine biosynthesis lipoprotein
MIRCISVGSLCVLLTLLSRVAGAAEPSMFAGPAMGTTYRVTLSRPLTRQRLGQLHRETDRLLASLDKQLSTWRQDSDATRFNAAEAGEWVDVGVDLLRVVLIGQQIHRQTHGRFDITVAPLVRWWESRLPPHKPSAQADALLNVDPPRDLLAQIGSTFIESRPASEHHPAAIRKLAPGVQIDLSAIGPGYAVDQIGERLVSLGSVNQLVELGGEVRAWGRRDDGSPWRVAIQSVGSGAPPAQSIELADGMAVAVAASINGRPVIDPRTGRLGRREQLGDLIIYADSCATADALATAALLPE